MEDRKEISPEEMEQVSGGHFHFLHIQEPYVEWTCPTCQKTYKVQEYKLIDYQNEHRECHANGTTPTDRWG